jgi:hypothetical protein
VQKGKCYRNFANYGLIRLNRFVSSFSPHLCNYFLIKLYLILLISVQTFDVTGAKILPFALLPFGGGSKHSLNPFNNTN